MASQIKDDSGITVGKNIHLVCPNTSRSVNTLQIGFAHVKSTFQGALVPVRAKQLPTKTQSVRLLHCNDLHRTRDQGQVNRQAPYITCCRDISKVCLVRSCCVNKSDVPLLLDQRSCNVSVIVCITEAQNIVRLQRQTLTS